MDDHARFVDDSEKWDNKELGASAEHVGVATDEEMKEAMDALGLHPISIRMQKGLIQDLKLIANSHQVGYQPLIRDILTRFVEAEKKEILRESFELMREKASAQEEEKANLSQPRAA